MSGPVKIVELVTNLPLDIITTSCILISRYMVARYAAAEGSSG